MPSSNSSLLLPSIPPSIRVFSTETTLHIRWPKYWSFSFSISPSKEHPGLTSFRMDWLDLLAVQGTLKSLLQHHSSKASILLCSVFFTVQSHIHTWPLEKPQPWLHGLFSFTFKKRLFSSSSLSAIRVVSSAYLRWLIFLPAILIPACASFSPAFHDVLCI